MYTPKFTCATCDTTVVDHPTFHLGLAFCCAGCAADGPCSCSYDREAEAADPVVVLDFAFADPAIVSHAAPRPRVMVVPQRADDRTLVSAEA